MGQFKAMYRQPTVDLYVTQVFALKNPKDELHPLLGLVAKKRRDLAPFEPDAGDFIVNQQDPRNHQRCVHMQLIPFEKLNQILLFNHRPLLTWPIVNKALAQRMMIVGAADNIAFTAHVDPDLVHKAYLGLPSYRINWDSLDNPVEPINYSKVESLWDLRASITVDQLTELRDSYWRLNYKAGPHEADQIKMNPQFGRGQYMSQQDFMQLLRQRSHHESHD